MLFWIWLSTIVGAIVLYLRNVYSRFSKYGVRHYTPVPFLGDMTKVVFRIQHFTKDIDDVLRDFPNERFIGRFAFTKPIIMVTDLELIKKIVIKDFDYFLDHLSFVDEKADPLFGRNLFSLKGQEWKDMRATLSPAFTSSKIRHMVPFMVEVGDQMVKVLKKKIEDSGAVDYIDIDGKDLSTRYANDVIASCAFGLSVNSHSDENNEFYVMGKKATTFTFAQVIKFMAQVGFPKLALVMDVCLFPKSFRAVFENIVLNTMRDREERHVIRQDMIHLLMELKKGRLTHETSTDNDLDAGFATVEESAVGTKKINRVWSDTDLVAQAALFLFAGFETVSVTMSFAIHELAVNPDVQERLYQEIKENEERIGGQFDYNTVQKMRYMDMVVSEVLRMWPPLPSLDRLCTRDYNLGRSNKDATQDFIVRKGESVAISVWGYHRNAEYFPNPFKFDPERFSEENKHNIKPFTYMPFGIGPRNCIGSRFALCEVKVLLYLLLKDMEIAPCSKTKIPVVLGSDSFSLKIDGGHWVRLRERNKKVVK